MDTFLGGGHATGYWHSYQLHQHQQQQQQHQVSGIKKIEIPRERLTDDEFDKIVVETSARLAMGRSRVKMESGYAGVITTGGQQEATMSVVRLNPTPAAAVIKLNQPKRPMNAFMVWGQAIRRELHNKFSNVQNALLSKALGRVWKRLDLNEKEPYVSKANIIKTNHKRDYPDYRYQPRRIQEKQRRILNQNQLNSCGGVGSSSSMSYNSNSRKSSAPINKPAVSTCSSSQSSSSSSTPSIINNPLQQNQHSHDPNQPVNQAPNAPIMYFHDPNPKVAPQQQATTNNYRDNIQQINHGCIYKSSLITSSNSGGGSSNNSSSLLSSNNNNINTTANNIVYGSSAIAEALPPHAMATKDLCYSANYDETSSQYHSSEAGDDTQQGQVYNNGQQHKLFLEAAGQLNYDDHHVCSTQGHQVDTSVFHHNQSLRHHHHQQLAIESNNNHFPSVLVTNPISQNDANNLEYQTYNQHQHQHPRQEQLQQPQQEHHNQRHHHHHRQQHQQQVIEDVDQYYNCAEQAPLYADANSHLNTSDLQIRSQMMAQASHLDNYDNVYRQVKRDTYRNYSDELCIV